jgi:hypothetical protein
MTGSPVSSLARPFRRAALPLAAYYAVTLAVPLVNGASDAFMAHAPIVLLVPIVIVVSTAAIGIVIRKTSLALQAAKRSFVSCGPHGRTNHEAASRGHEAHEAWDFNSGTS